MKQEDYEKYKRTTIELIKRLNEDPELVEILESCPDRVAVPLLIGLLEKQDESSEIATASIKLGAIASMIATISMIITAVALAVASENLWIGILFIALAIILYYYARKVTHFGER